MWCREYRFSYRDWYDKQCNPVFEPKSIKLIGKLGIHSQVSWVLFKFGAVIAAVFLVALT
ncbi:hypothetical protein ACM6Q7_07460 [Peribacillus butanolivorans]|uniref:hypothetical protein n=1 Tax=Peribacillus butanolivorans TaxID=421767 RepID=UPI0039FC9C84